MTAIRKVTLNFAPVTIQVSGNSNEELLNNAMKTFVDQLSVSTLPQIDSYSVGAAMPLSFDTVYAGLIVESFNGNVGIVHQVNKQTIDVTYASGTSVSGSPELFKPSNASFKKARYRRSAEDKEQNNWSVGHSGFIKNDMSKLPVIVGKVSRGKFKVHIVGDKKHETFTEEEMERFVMDQTYNFI